MLGDLYLPGTTSVPDRDLLARLSQYFNTLDARLREGQGWFIFSGSRDRATRIANYIRHRLGEFRPFVSYFFVPWRDFSLSAYMRQVELADVPADPAEPGGEMLSPEYRIATRVTEDTYYQMLHCDVLIIAGLAPRHRHELEYLDQVTDSRFRQHLANVLISPRLMTDLWADFSAVDNLGRVIWDRVFDRMYRSSLIAC